MARDLKKAARFISWMGGVVSYVGSLMCGGVLVRDLPRYAESRNESSRDWSPPLPDLTMGENEN